MGAKIEFHYDGPIAEDHKIPLRVLGTTLIHFQSAIDRAYLDNKYGNVWKFSRLKRDDYPLVDFIVGTPREGGYILDLIKEDGDAIVKRISKAIRNVRAAPWDAGQDEVTHLVAQVQRRANQLDAGIYTGRSLAEFAINPGTEDLFRYGDRSIAKEVDQILSHIRRDPPDGVEESNSLELTFRFSRHQQTIYRFDQNAANIFHKKVSRRELGEPLRYSGKLRSIDRGRPGIGGQRPKAKLTLEGSNRDIILHIGTNAAYEILAPYMQGEQSIEILASPILEFNSFDPNSGDAFFIRID